MVWSVWKTKLYVDSKSGRGPKNSHYGMRSKFPLCKSFVCEISHICSSWKMRKWNQVFVVFVQKDFGFSNIEKSTIEKLKILYFTLYLSVRILNTWRKNERWHPLGKRRKSHPQICLLPRALEIPNISKSHSFSFPTWGISLVGFPQQRKWDFRSPS